MTLTLPFVHLNLRRNPFGELTPAERAALAVVDLGELPTLLGDPRAAVQFVGDHGRGKSTHLLALRAAVAAEAPLVRIDPDVPPPPIPEAPVVLVDEVCRLGWRRRRRLFRRHPGALALGSHVDFTRALRRAGRQVVTIEVGGTSAATIHALVAARIEAARRDAAAPVPVVTRAAADRLHTRFGDDVRGLLHHLYDVFQALEAPGEVDVA